MDSNITALIDALDNDPELRTQAQKSLVALGAEAVEPLIAAVRAESGRKVWGALQVLGEMGDVRALPVILESLRSSTPIIISAAVAALQKFPNEDIAMHLIDALPHTRGMGQQDMIVVLQRLGDTRAIPLLIEQLGTVESPPLRVAIIQALGKLGDTSAIPVIKAYADDPDHHVRDWVVVALEQLGGAN